MIPLSNYMLKITIRYMKLINLPSKRTVEITQTIVHVIHKAARTDNHGLQVVITITIADTATEITTEIIVPSNSVFRMSNI